MAIETRLNHKLSLGDAIIAATAINHKLTLVTRNIKDFEKVKHLKLLNPFKK
jgi:predicted nucleic acid-binding protein